MVIRLDSNIKRLKLLLAEGQAAGTSIGFVATMGSLHCGHQSLIDASRRQGLFTVVSIFVNPTQFGPNEDLDAYPRDPAGDMAACEAAGADLIWFPDVSDLFPDTAQTTVAPSALAQRLCGISRPAFFGGICTVVLKLFNLIKPSFAFFGEKDYQQLAIIRQMVNDFYLDVEVIGVPTMRETDGLAMSSRNARLNPSQRKIALNLWRMLCLARSAFADGDRNAEQVRNRLLDTWPDGLTLDYLEFRDPIQLEPVAVLSADTRILLGAWLDGIRLIDNIALASNVRVSS